MISNLSIIEFFFQPFFIFFLFNKKIQDHITKKNIHDENIVLSVESKILG
jgi:hypothetical protein